MSTAPGKSEKSENAKLQTLPLEKKVFAKLDISCKAEYVNSPKTGNFFKNNRGESMHFKYYLPNNNSLTPGAIKHFYVYIHGLDAHINRYVYVSYYSMGTINHI